MALALTHILLTIFVLDLFRHYHFGKKKFPRYLLVVGGIAGLAPDIDIPLSFIWNLASGNVDSLHGAFTHSLLFVLIFAILGFYLGSSASFLKSKKLQSKWAAIFYVIAFGWLMHLSLDCLYGSYKLFLWPINFDTLAFCPDIGFLQTYRISIDALLLVGWLIHEEMHGLVKDYW